MKLFDKAFFIQPSKYMFCLLSVNIMRINIRHGKNVGNVSFFIGDWTVCPLYMDSIGKTFHHLHYILNSRRSNFWIREVKWIGNCQKYLCFPGMLNKRWIQKKSANSVWKVSVFGVFLVHIRANFQAFIYSVNLRIHSKCRKTRTRKTPKTDTFYGELTLDRRVFRTLSNIHNVFEKTPSSMF